MKVTRTIVYEGPVEWVTKVIRMSLGDGVHQPREGHTITLTTIERTSELPEGIYPLGRPIDPRRDV